ncbi:predicted protein [Histoplasma capsulatum H143]|uniref:Uncharacterized protein n=1 Tax=Ajellomyces capsulatus (strain H143) TaxID=544712 RepID=C6HBG3_AJECH|nr:predicted protein [Histoplasma capsulatum H143]
MIEFRAGGSADADLDFHFRRKSSAFFIVEPITAFPQLPQILAASTRGKDRPIAASTQQHHHHRQGCMAEILMTMHGGQYMAIALLVRPIDSDPCDPEAEAEAEASCLSKAGVVRS